MSRRFPALLAALCGSLVAPAVVPAQSVQLPPQFENLTLPHDFILMTDLVFAPDGTLFVLQKQGRVRVFDPAGELQAKSLIDLVPEVNNDHDRGLLALALHPGWVPDGGETSWIYMLYTVSPVFGQDLGYNENDQYSFSRLTRWRSHFDAFGDLVAILQSRQVLLGNQLPDGTVPDGIATLHHSHSNGTLQFGSDGTLILSTGDGAHYDFVDAGGANPAAFDDFVHPVTGLKGPNSVVQDTGSFRAQQLESLSGKVLRIDPETGLGLPSNPFYDGNPDSPASRVWALGLRNPFKLALVPGTGSSVPRAGQPGVLDVADVGWNLWEDLNISRGGENFGWPCFEGPAVNPGYAAVNPPDPGFPDCATQPVGVLTPPALAWHHHQAGLIEPAGLHFDSNGQPGPGFLGRCAMVGPVYTAGSFPAEYHDRLFVFDYVSGWLRSAELAPDGSLLGLHDFATGLTSPTDVALHPLTGELYWCDIVGQRIHIIRHSDNLTPTAVPAALSAKMGPLPLTVAFTGAGSFDPEGQPLTYSWDWGDGSPPGSGVFAQHTWTAMGVYEVRLTVTDPGGQSGTSAPILVSAGGFPPQVTLLSPQPGQTYHAPTVMPLSGAASDPDGDPIAAWEWNVDLYHDTHVHPSSFTSTEQQTELTLDLHGGSGALVYHRVELSATDTTGATGSRHVFIYAEHDVQDLTGQMRPISSLDALVPPGPQGPGEHDLEIVRDGQFPPAGSSDPLTQYDTRHPVGAQSDVWIGYEFSVPPGPEQRFTSLVFQEGLHAANGGWFGSFQVEVRAGGVWSPVDNLQVSPPYPFELAGEPGFDGQGFDTYELHFDPAAGTAIRLRGTPGGAGGWASVAELRARLVRITPQLPLRDITDASSAVVAKVLNLNPPGPLGSGNPDPDTLRNGSFPPPGSASLIGQYDTSHPGQTGGLDWFGLVFPEARVITGLLFQEGLDTPQGGAFLAGSLGVEVRLGQGQTWQPVTGLVAAPPYPGPNGNSYETFLLSFEPVVADRVRIVGLPSGSEHYSSAGELRVLAPAVPPELQSTSWHGEPGGANTLLLSAPDPAALGLPLLLNGSAARGPAPGALWIGLAPAHLPHAGGTILIDPTAPLQLSLGWDLAGKFTLAGTLPETPALLGLQLHVQAFAFNQPAPWPLRFSNGVKLTLGQWP